MSVETARLSAAAHHVSMKGFVERAARDLDEAVAWLEVGADRLPDAESRWLSFVQSIVEVAASRLRVADHALRTHGPNATL